MNCLQYLIAFLDDDEGWRKMYEKIQELYIEPYEIIIKN